MFQKNAKSEYQAPQVEILEARVERGFEVSNPNPEPQPDGSTNESYGNIGVTSRFS